MLKTKQKHIYQSHHESSNWDNTSFFTGYYLFKKLYFCKLATNLFCCLPFIYR